MNTIDFNEVRQTIIEKKIVRQEFCDNGANAILIELQKQRDGSFDVIKSKAGIYSDIFFYGIPVSFDFAELTIEGVKAQLEAEFPEVIITVNKI